LLFALPLLIAYEVLALAVMRFTEVDLRNAADVIVRSVLAGLGLYGNRALFAVIIAVAVVLIVREQRQRRVPLKAGVFVGMTVESVALALCFGAVVSRLTALLLPSFLTGLQAASASPLPALAAHVQIERLPLAQQLVLSLGAGLYEELVFRVVLVTGIAWLMQRVPGVSHLAGGVIAVLASALLFSAFHYIGAFGDTFELASFTFRLVGGIVFSAIYLLRGFGIVAWTHALYDVFLLTALALR
jgi:membrane protease YdiL (CAAX protease family)